MSKERNYGIDLLRLVLMYMVCVLHVLGRGGVLSSSVQGTVGYRVFWLLETLSYCAVDGFAIISGYMANDKPRKISKLIEMWLQVLFYSFVLTLILTIIGLNDTWGKRAILKSLLPVTSDYYWYFTAYFALFLSIPILNKFLFNIDVNNARKAFITIVFVFSFMESVSSAFKTNGGYSAIWLMVLYCIGVLAKKINLFEKWHSVTLIAIWALCILLSWGLHAFFGIQRLITYVSPTILLSGIIMVVLFSRMRIHSSMIKVIKKTSPLAFGVYLWQLNKVFWDKYLNGAFVGIVSQPIPVGVTLVIFGGG